MRAVRLALAIVIALAAYVRHNRHSAAGSITYDADTGEYYALFSPKTSTRIEAGLFCSEMGGRLPTLENNRRRQDAVHALLQLYSSSNNLYVWVEDDCLRGACPPVNTSSWLYANYETQFADAPWEAQSPNLGYIALGRHSNRLRHFAHDSALVTGVVCVYDSAWRNEECESITGLKFTHFLCIDHGFCIRSTDVTEGHCFCNVGYGGIDCLDMTSSCASNPCRNGATCSPQNSGVHVCECRSGFDGAACERNIDDCAANGDVLCSGAAPCEDRRSGYYCSCFNTGRRGANCSEIVDPCASRPCANGGACQELSDSSYMCRCAPGYEGSNCQDDIDECRSDPCHGSRCFNEGPNEYSCACSANRTGMNCETEYDPCSPNPCQFDGHCSYSTLGRFFECNCTGTGRSNIICSQDIDECADDVTLCQPPNGQCMNSQGGYECICNQGFIGPSCDATTSTIASTANALPTSSATGDDVSASNAATIHSSTTSIHSSATTVHSSTTNEAADASAVFNLQSDSPLVPVIAGVVGLLLMVGTLTALFVICRKRQRERPSDDTYAGSAYTYEGSLPSVTRRQLSTIVLARQLSIIALAQHTTLMARRITTIMSVAWTTIMAVAWTVANTSQHVHISTVY